MPEMPEERKTAQETAAAYYGLEKNAVEELAGANSANSPAVSREELKKYRGRKKLSVPDTLKALFAKFWFAAAVCFFFMWGLSIPNALDLLVVLSLAGGLVTDLLTNGTLRLLAKTEGQFDRFMMWPGRKKLITLPLNVLHSALVTVLVYLFYNVLNTLLIRLLSLPEDSVPLGVEPILFGLFYLGFDLLIILVKNTLVRIVNDAKKKA